MTSPFPAIHTGAAAAATEKVDHAKATIKQSKDLLDQIDALITK